MVMRLFTVNTAQTGAETAISIGLEVIPALIGGIGFGLAGGAGGSAVGNYLSQKYRMSRGLQDEFGLGEFGAATALGGFPVGKFADKCQYSEVVTQLHYKELLYEQVRVQH